MAGRAGLFPCSGNLPESEYHPLMCGRHLLALGLKIPEGDSIVEISSKGAATNSFLLSQKQTTLQGKLTRDIQPT